MHGIEVDVQSKSEGTTHPLIFLTSLAVYDVVQYRIRQHNTRQIRHSKGKTSGDLHDPCSRFLIYTQSPGPAEDRIQITDDRPS